MREMDAVVDDFFGRLRDFVKRNEDDVAQLRRTSDSGSTLGPQQLKERLKAMQRRCTDVETTLTDLESRTMDATTLSELLNHCLTVHQNITTRTEQLCVHLQNYGYQSILPEAPSIDFGSLMTPIKQTVMEGVASPWNVSIRQSHDPLTHLDYSVTPRKEETAQKLETAASFRSSSRSQEVLQCSPGTLALKKKYSDIRWHPTAPSSHSPVERRSIENSQSDSFEFRPHSIDPTSNQRPSQIIDIQDHPQMKPLTIGDGASEIAEMDVDVSPVAHLDETDCHGSTSDLHAIAMRDGRRPSLRLSFDSKPLKFGSPYRTHLKAEKSIDIASPPYKIPVELYDTLPSYLKGAISLCRLNAAFDRRGEDVAEEGFLTAASMEQLYDTSILQSFVKLGILERDFHNGEMGYRWHS